MVHYGIDEDMVVTDIIYDPKRKTTDEALTGIKC